MLNEETTYRLEEVFSNFYKIESIEKINYNQYTCKNKDDQWALRTEMLLRKGDPKCLVASLSRELWCFSMNDNALPIIYNSALNNSIYSKNGNKDDFLGNDNDLSAMELNNTDEDSMILPDKSGVFDSNYSKPNLPPAYAIFLKALRRVIYVNLTLRSNHTLFPIGNGCIVLNFSNYKNETSISSPVTNRNNEDIDLNIKPSLGTTVNTEILQIEPHLFENGDLTISVSLKESDLIPLTIENIKSAYEQTSTNHNAFLKEQAIYILPSGTRVYLPTTDINDCLTSAPENSEVLLKTISVSHGVNLLFKKNDIQWVKIVPNLTHFNGQIPKIASFNEPSPSIRTISWPLDLIYIHPSLNHLSALSISSPPSSFQLNNTKSFKQDSNFNPNSNNETKMFTSDLDDAFNVIDNFIQLRQSSAYRTPGTSGLLSGNNHSSSGGAYTDQFQNFHKNTASNMNTNIGTSNNIPPLMNNPGSITSTSNTNSFSNLDSKFTPNVDQYLPVKNSPLSTHLDKNSQVSSVNNITVKAESLIETSPQIKNNDENLGLIQKQSDTSKELSNTESMSINSAEDKELFGEDFEDYEDDEFGNSLNESYNISEKTNKPKGTSDEITEDMFGMSDDEDGESNNAYNSRFNNGLDPGNQLTHKEKEANKLRGTQEYKRMKRKYLDIPLEEITLSNSPLYMDPGAPLPIDTPRERRKSVFAPLNFNPIIENNVDNKYKSGGKFSFDPSQIEEALNFDISKNSISDSEDDSDASDELEDLQYKSDYKNTDYNTIESSYTNNNVPIQDLQSQLSAGLLKGDHLGNVYPNTNEYSKDGIESIWKSPPVDSLNNNSPVRLTDTQMTYMDSESKSGLDIFPKFNLVQEKAIKESKPVDLNINNEVFDETTTTKLLGKIPKEPKGTHYEFTPSSIASLPFLFRHMPISSMPEIYSISNPTVKIKENNQNILNLISEQIIFDVDKLENLGYPVKSYKGITSCSNGLLTTTVNDLFSSFERLNGTMLINKMYINKSPSVYTKKHHEIIKIRADSQPFSKYLNCKPIKGIKNFKLLLLTSSYRQDCGTFVSTLCQTYIGHEFGFCERLKLNEEDEEGMMFLENFKDSKLLLLATQIVAYCLTTQNAGKPIPILLMFPLRTNSLSELVFVASKFQIIYDEVRSKIPNAEIFFKTILTEFIKNPLTLIDDYFELAASIYNILPQKSVKFTTIVPKHHDKIKFRTLQANSSPSVIHYDAYIHLAYSRSIDKEWLFAAFSDSYGNNTSTKVWYVGCSKAKFDQACTEIWASALNLASTKYGKICLILTRLNSILPDDELMNWRRLSGRNIHLAVVCVNDTAKLSFYDEDRVYPTYKPFFKDELLSEPLVPYKLDDYELRDINQELHSVIFEYPFPLSNSQHRCAIKSGALIKFRATEGKSLWSKFEVNLLNCPHSDSTQLLQTILYDFSNLSALNTWFGISNGEISHIPWHVLAVKKMMNTMVHINVEVEE